MKRKAMASIGLTLTELMMVSFVLSIVVICIFRALTLFTQGAIKIQRDLPVQRALQAASFMLTADLLASPRSTINNILPNPGFEDLSNKIEMSAAPTADTWSYMPKRMGWSHNEHFYFVRNQSKLAVDGNQCLVIFCADSPAAVTSPTLGPTEKTEPFLFSLSLMTTNINFNIRAEVRQAVNPVLLFSAAPLVSIIYTGNWSVQSTSFSATAGHFQQVKLASLAGVNGVSTAAFDNVYLGPFSVEVSTSHPSGRLFMTRSNSEGERERVEYTLTVNAYGAGRLMRKIIQTSGMESVTSFDGIDSLKVSWVGGPSPTAGTNRPLLVELVGRRTTTDPTDTMAMAFEVYPRVP